MKTYKGSCNWCGQHIEFTAEQAGKIVCPTCQRETYLIPDVPPWYKTAWSWTKNFFIELISTLFPAVAQIIVAIAVLIKFLLIIGVVIFIIGLVISFSSQLTLVTNLLLLGIFFGVISIASAIRPKKKD